MAEKQTARYGAVGNPRQMFLRPHGRPCARVEAVISVKPAHAPNRVIQGYDLFEFGDGHQRHAQEMQGRSSRSVHADGWQLL